MHIDVLHILRCLVWKQLKVQRLTEQYVSLLFCGILFFVLRYQKSADLKSINSEVNDKFVRSEKLKNYNITYTPVSELTEFLMSSLCAAENCNVHKLIDGNLKRKHEDMTVVTFYGDNLENNLNFTVNFNIDPKTNTTIDTIHAWLNLVQLSIHQQYLEFKQINWTYYRANITFQENDIYDSKRISLETINYMFDKITIRIFLFKLAFIFILKTVKDVMQERATMLKHFTILCNVPEIFIWFGHVLQRMITNVFIALAISLILSEYEAVKWYIIWSFLTTFCLAGIVQGFLFSSITQYYNLNIMLMFVLWFLIYPIPTRNLRDYLLFCLSPGFALQIGYQIIHNHNIRDSVIADRNLHSLKLSYVILMLLFDVLWMSLLTYFFYKVRNNR